MAKPKLGSGKRFSRWREETRSFLESEVGASAAYIGRKKYGAKKMAKLSARGRKR